MTINIDENLSQEFDIEYKISEPSIFENNISENLITKDEDTNFSLDTDIKIAVPSRKRRKFKLIDLKE